MVNKDMLDYIKMLRIQGKNDEQIKASLLPGGYRLADIEEALKSFDAAQKIKADNIQRVNVGQGRMRTLIVVLLLSVAAVMVIGKIFHNVPRNVQVSGADIQINCGKVRITAVASPESSYDFVINSGSSNEFNDGLFAAWTMEQANSLKARYGDFTHCNSAGSQAGMSSLDNVIVFAADDSVRAKLNNLVKISVNEPVVEFKASRLSIKEQTYNNAKIAWNGLSGQVVYYLVKDVTILRDNYNKQ